MSTTREKADSSYTEQHHSPHTSNNHHHPYHEYDEEGPPPPSTGHNMSIARYFATRIPTLKPPMDRIENPFTVLAMLSFKQWMYFLVAFLGWTWDAFDFFSVSLTVRELAAQFDKTTAQITWGITLVLM